MEELKVIKELSDIIWGIAPKPKPKPKPKKKKSKKSAK
tara:strand:- start:38 stop:151 length:114 start_codon:yes stop_codon:yes gene_type:complete